MLFVLPLFRLLNHRRHQLARRLAPAANASTQSRECVVQ
jgi:hypothetical protein